VSCGNQRVAAEADPYPSTGAFKTVLNGGFDYDNDYDKDNDKEKKDEY